MARTKTDAAASTTVAAVLETKLSKLKVAELDAVMRDCGLTLGTGKAHKVQSLSAFIRASQQLAFERFQGHASGKPHGLAAAHASFVPNEVVSIDIGFRNLAFAHVARSGKVLAWRRVELLKEATFEPWVLASTVERFVRDVLPVRPALQCTYIIEHQRFRSQGSAAVTNSVMVNNLIEALLYANLRHAGAHIEAVNPTNVSTQLRIPDTWQNLEDDAQSEPSLGSKAGAGNPGQGEKSDLPSQNGSLAQTIVRMDRLLAELKQLTGSQHDAILQALGQRAPKRRASRSVEPRDVAELQQQSTKQLGTQRDLRRRLLKKERAVSLVQSSMLAFLTTKAGQSGRPRIPPLRDDPELAQMLSFGSCQGMVFSDEMCEQFCAEKKKDDLCDCIIQAAAWYKWQHNVVDTMDQLGTSTEPKAA
ncbi:hypothetical protein H4S01_000784 [Coemansia sp. RSA 2610]|nr:hypothetical protein H4S01_000784 [Coemansia sp. RSA 2610]